MTIYTVESHRGAEPMVASVLADGQIIALAMNVGIAMDIAHGLDLQQRDHSWREDRRG